MQRDFNLLILLEVLTRFYMISAQLFTSTGSAPPGYINLDTSFKTNDWELTDDFTGYKCSELGNIIIMDYDDAVTFCNKYDSCLGFSDVGCDKLGPFVICENKYVQEYTYPICVIAKEEKKYGLLNDYQPGVVKTMTIMH